MPDPHQPGIKFSLKTKKKIQKRNEIQKKRAKPVTKKVPAAKKRRVEFINDEEIEDTNLGGELVLRRSVRQSRRPFRFQDFLDDKGEGEEEDDPLDKSLTLHLSEQEFD